MDLEKLIAGSHGLGDGYTFSQTSTLVSVSIPIGPKVEKSQVNVSFMEADNSIFVGVDGSQPILCGVLWGRAYKKSVELVDSAFIVKFQKEDQVTWPLLIGKPSSCGLDTKSQFLIGVFEDASTQFLQAFRNFSESAEKGFIPAKIVVADILLSDFNVYGVDPNLEAAIQMLRTIPFEKREEAVTLKLAASLKKIGYIDDAQTILAQSVETSDSARLALAKLLSPLCGGSGNAKDATKHFEVLADKRNVEAMRLLALHFSQGVGVDKDMDRAIELDKKAIALDPSLEPQFSTSDMTKGVVIASVISAGIIGVAFASFIWARKRTQL